MLRNQRFLPEHEEGPKLVLTIKQRSTSRWVGTEEATVSNQSVEVVRMIINPSPD